MKKMMYILLFCLFGISATVCAQIFTQDGLSCAVRADIEKKIFGNEGRNIWTSPFFGGYLKNDLGYFLQVMLVVDPSVDSIRFSNSTVTIYGDYPKRFACESGYGNLYEQYHDIYSSLFSFEEVHAVSVWNCWDDCRNITYLPMKSDEFAVRIENAIFKRDWYIPGMDYYSLLEDNLEDMDCYDENEDFLSSVLGSLIGITDIKYYVEYYPDSDAVKETWQSSPFNGTIGLSREYDKNGKLIKTQNFVYPRKGYYEADDKYITYIIISDYYNNGMPKNRKVYLNFSYYESDPPTGDDNDAYKAWYLGVL